MSELTVDIAIRCVTDFCLSCTDHDKYYKIRLEITFLQFYIIEHAFTTWVATKKTRKM